LSSVWVRVWTGQEPVVGEVTVVMHVTSIPVGTRQVSRKTGVRWRRRVKAPDCLRRWWLADGGIETRIGRETVGAVLGTGGGQSGA